ncbi:unnamed protein product, partial [Ilex paraguariensis]
PDLVIGELAILPLEIVSETKERSLLASWCPQEQVLNHRSVRGFLTHCEWNSTIESICGEQQTNCWFCCNHLGIGIEIGGHAKREEVEGLVRELIVGEKGKVMKKKAMEWKKKAEEATTCSSGSSCMNFEKMVKLLLMTSGSNLQCRLIDFIEEFNLPIKRI